MPHITTKTGLIVAVCAWLVLVYLSVGNAECLRFDMCDSDDLMLSSIIGIGMIVPAYLLGAIVSIFVGGDTNY